MARARGASGRGFLVGLVGAAATIAAGPGHAQKTIVIEFYEGERPEDADQHVGPVLDELRANGAATGVGEAYEGRMSRPGIAVDLATLAGFPALADEGFRAWTDARFGDAVALLERATRTARQAPAAMLTDEMRAAYRLALVGLTLAHKRQGHAPEARETMAELVRSFPDLPLHASEFGPEAARLHDEVRSSLARLGHGSLSVVVDDPDAIVFVNEQYRSAPDRLKNLVPGLYRVVARKRQTTGRTYLAEVEAGKTASVRIAWALDQLLHTSPSWTGLVFPDPASGRGLERHATQLARLLGATTVIAVGIGGDEGRRSVIGKEFVVGRSGPRRTASVAIEPFEAPARILTQLGAYLAGATSEPPPRQPVAADLAAAAAEGSPAPRRALLWSTLATGAVAIGAGAYLVRIDGRGTCDEMAGQVTCPHIFDSTAWGYGLVTAGSVAVVGSAYFLWRWRRRAPAVSIRVGPGRGVALAGQF